MLSWFLHLPVMLGRDEGLDEIENEPLADDLELGAEIPDWTPSSHELQALQQAHDNAGVPFLRRFVRLLKQGGARPEVVRWTSGNFHCPACEQARRPLARTPSSVPGSSRFNGIIGMDTFEMTNAYSQKTEVWLHVLCWGTSYGIAERMSSKEAVETWRAYSTCWRRYFGDADVAVVDLGTEFQSPFSEAIGMGGALLHPVDVESPWLNGRTERRHGELRHQIELMLAEMVPQSDEEWLSMVAAAVMARNSYHNEKGFSPLQRVLGLQPRLSGDLCQEGWPDSIFEGPLQSMRRSADIRHAANRAYLEQQHRDRLLQAMRTRHRMPGVPLVPGMRVWVWRKPARGRQEGWYGPGVILAKTGSGAFVQIKGALWKVSEQQMRPQTEEDKLGWDLVHRFLHHLKHELAQDQPLRRRYIDCTREPVPNENDVPGFPTMPAPEGWSPDQEPEGDLPTGEVRPREEVADEIGEVLEPPRRRIRVDEAQDGSFPFRGTSTALPQRDVQPTSFLQSQVEIAQKGIVKLSALPTDAHRDLFLKGSRLKESRALEDVLEPIYGPKQI